MISAQEGCGLQEKSDFVSQTAPRTRDISIKVKRARSGKEI
jgi:hypothetical protein